MPPRGVTSSKRKRQYEHIKESEESRGVGENRAEEIAARTVNKQRSQAGETKSSRGGSRKTTRSSAGSKRTSTGGRKAGSTRKAASSSTRSTSTRKSSGKRAMKKR